MTRITFLTTALVSAMLVYAAAAGAQSFAPIQGQRMVDVILAKHTEITVMAMHVTPPTQADNIIIASNIGRIGKKADADDLSVLASGQPRIERTKTGDLSVELLMLDVSGKTVGVLGATFNAKIATDKVAALKLAEIVRDELRAQTPSLESLFVPAH